jgi:hypothetical protein
MATRRGGVVLVNIDPTLLDPAIIGTGNPRRNIVSKPLDCTALPINATVGKHDFRADESVKRVGFRPELQSTLTPKQHLTTAQNIVNRALLNGTMSRQEALRAKECLEEVVKALC